MDNPDKTKTTMLSDLRSSFDKGDHEEVERIRQELYNVIASEAKRDHDLLKLNLLAASDECSRQGLMGANSVMSTLLAFYSFGPDKFDLMCGLILGPVCSSIMRKLTEEMDKVRSEVRSDMTTEVEG